MMQKKLRTLFEEVAAGRLDIDAAVRNLRTPEMVDLGFARVDIDRSRRRGIPEVVFGEGKTPTQIAALLRTLDAEGQRALATRVKPDAAHIVLEELPDMPVVYAEDARCLYVERVPAEIVGVGTVLVVSAGTADGPVAAEAALTARLCGNRVETVSDVGVAGLHRLLAEQERLRAANVLIVCAGMEGALPSVVAGLVGRPVIAVPTSTGYGVSLEGLAALMGMLSACAAGVTVVNIDNGFGAAYAATLINRRPEV